MKGLWAIVLEDKYSVFGKDKTKVKYASAGERVQIVSESGEVAICENIKGKRFSIQKSKLSIQ